MGVEDINLLDPALLREPVFEEIDIGIVVLNAQGRIELWNRWMAQHSSIFASNAVGMAFSELFPDMSQRLAQAIDDALGKSLGSVLSVRFNPENLALFATTEDQEHRRRIEQSILVSPISFRQARGCLIQVRDATRASQHEYSLKRSTHEIQTIASRAREQELKLQLILNNTLDAILILNPLGRISSFYRSAQQMFGYTEFELLGKPLSVLFPPPLSQQIDILLSPDRKREKPIDFFDKARCLKNDGMLFFAELAIREIFEGNEQQFIVTISDITERQLTQDALYREKEQAQVTLNSIADGVITTDIIGQITYINPAALKLIGHSIDEMVGKRLDKVLTIQSERDKLPVFECIESGVQVDSTIGDILISNTGNEMVIHQVASPIHNQLGDTVGAVMIFRDVSKSHRMASRLSWQASHDELTGLINRREFERQLDMIIERARNEPGQHCLCFMDLDKFKVVNDTCGHAAGDELLRQLADLFRGKIRGADILARISGDEFAIILTQCELGPAMNIAEDLRSNVEDFRFAWAGQSFQIGVSIGVVVVDAHSPDHEEVFKAADSACYAAKSAGRNRVHVYSQDDQEIRDRRGEAQWMVRIQHALEENQFRLFYQPIVPVQEDIDGPVHYEILLRMVGDDDELIPPGAFIPAAERYQIMSKIDMWVIEHLLSWIAQHWDLSSTEVFAINLSGQSMTEEKLLRHIREMLEQYAIPPDRICFEITETAAIRNLSKAQQFMDEMKTIGCRFALDDFGSGLSSFAYLKTLSVDYLKIDGAFVKDMVDDPIDFAMVESIRNIGSILELKTIAEFVENDQVRKALAQVGVDFAQGYGIAKPKPLPMDKTGLLSLLD